VQTAVRPVLAENAHLFENCSQEVRPGVLAWLRVSNGCLWSVCSCLSKNCDSSLWTKLSQILCLVFVPCGAIQRLSSGENIRQALRFLAW